ncbi:MAG: hypothetical protein IJK89_02310 [Clostridia bacterium]|nr:hypothetical protein [Clostridia bacterium]
MYQLIVKIGLIFTILWNICCGAARPVRQQTATENGSLSAVDELGRKVVTAGQSDKQVGVFYFLWNGEESTSGPYDVGKIIERDPQAYLSAERWEAAGGGAYAVFHHWGEPLFGYYFQSDKWVLARHCQMLTDAGVDFIVFDTTNARPYIERAKDLIDVWYTYLEDGWNVPKLAFYTNSDSADTMAAIYDGLYNNAEMKAKYPRLDELWFRLNGKPMIVGWQEDPNLRDDVRRFFRIKSTQWPNADKGSDGFPWMEFNRLEKIDSYYKNSPKDKSVMSVSAAQHCDTIRFSSSAWYDGRDHGRSWHNGAKDTSPDAVKYGYNFAEQWEYAIKLDPDIVFVTGFNEWTAMRLGIQEEPICFVDNCDTEYSRDVEPSAGILGDNYYMQMARYIAKFKRSSAALPESVNVTIDVNGSFDQWDNPSIKAVYRDFRGDTFDRDCCGFGDLHFTDDTGRNDIVRAKIAEDSRYLYYYVETADTLSPASDSAWMTLFLNVNGKKPGYDFCVNRTSPANGKTTIEAITDAGYESRGQADIRFEGNRLMLRVPKAALGLAGNKKAAFTFKWADNYEEGNLMSFYTRGDSAPYGRLNWVYGTRP